MSARPPMRVARYARAVERLWQRARDRPGVLSPREWELVQRWFDRGIPLAIVEEALASASERSGRRTGPPRSLGYIAAAVEESWAAVLSGRLGGEGAVRPAPAQARDAWRDAKRREGADSPLGRRLADLLDRLQRGASPTEIDLELDRELPRAVSRAALEDVCREVDRDLAPFRNRLPAAQLAATREKAIVERLRGRLGLPRLA